MHYNSTIARPAPSNTALEPLEGDLLGELMKTINTLDSSRYQQRVLPTSGQPIVVIKDTVPARLSVIQTGSGSDSADIPAADVKRFGMIARNLFRMFIVGLAALLAFGAVSAVSPGAAQANVGPLMESISNLHDSASNTSIGITLVDGRYSSLVSGTFNYRVNIKAFTIPNGWCANVKYNNGSWQRRTAGTYTSFVDGVTLTIDPYKTQSNGVCA